ncbi:hypothetical protein M408DRAFT_293299 [Serendipita vermifera MAFF 305830]|uniref:Uncharacterized protein n=1 Tax=Serendipita vermifera MAFF 305830 TaxID=933852 RepID=A0A0C3ASD4_SERVB|nr:hypothetical protein M408DRAFT_293299 [Serendipita vermifera MAFF 305830]
MPLRLSYVIAYRHSLTRYSPLTEHALCGRDDWRRPDNHPSSRRYYRMGSRSCPYLQFSHRQSRLCDVRSMGNGHVLRCTSESPVSCNQQSRIMARPCSKRRGTDTGPDQGRLRPTDGVRHVQIISMDGVWRDPMAHHWPHAHVCSYHDLELGVAIARCCRCYPRVYCPRFAFRPLSSLVYDCGDIPRT